jgi:hypothetical protein
MSSSRGAALFLLLALWACGGNSSCNCTGYTPLARGQFVGERVDTAGAFQLTSSGFQKLSSTALLEQFAPDASITTDVPCSIETVSILGANVNLTVGDTGSDMCTAETCGRLDGRCDARDIGQPITIDISSLKLNPKGPDVVEAIILANVKTGLIPISSVSRNSSLCLFTNPLKCTFDLDTTRASPPDVELGINIKLTIDTKWDKLLSVEVADISGTNACGGSNVQPRCIDGADMIIANAGSCSACTAANFSIVKNLIANSLGKALKKNLDKTIGKAACTKCSAGVACPSGPNNARSACQLDVSADAGICLDTVTMKCVPNLIGTEGTLEVSSLLANLNAPTDSALNISLVAGGGVNVKDAGVTIGLRGGFEPFVVPDCVVPKTRPAMLPLALPRFETEFSTNDFALSLSEQSLSHFFFSLQQSGALCLEINQSTVAQLESKTVGVLLPSLGALTYGQSVPLKLVLRPQLPPVATMGAGTFNMNGSINEPLFNLDWKNLEMDMYVLLEERYVRLFTVEVDLLLPFGLKVEACGLKPVIGNLGMAVPRVLVKNSEMLTEDLSVIANLIPTLISLAQPQLAAGLPSVALPEFSGFGLKVTDVKGIVPNAGTRFFHMGIAGQLIDAGTVCVP